MKTTLAAAALLAAWPPVSVSERLERWPAWHTQPTAALPMA